MKQVAYDRASRDKEEAYEKNKEAETAELAKEKSYAFPQNIH